MVASTNQSTDTNKGQAKDDASCCGFKIPNVDTAEIIDSYKKNLEVLGLINKMSTEICSGIFKLQTAFVKQMAADISGLASAKPTEAMSKFSEVTRDSIVRAVGNSKQISEMLTVANNDLTAAVAKRFKESVEAAKKFMK
jgi:phasin family protein